MNSNHRPVAIPARLSESCGGDPRIAGANKLFDALVELVRVSGFDPTVLTDPGSDLSHYSGLVLPGGGDVDPSRYGGAAAEALYDVNAEQDMLDFRLTEQAISLGIPILGICRGAQVINVALGGRLFEDLPQSSVQHYRPALEDEVMAFAWHDVQVLTGTHLEGKSGPGRFSIASGHHQGISQLAPSLRTAAAADDGLVEAFEDAAGTIVGVQWHPEAAGMEPVIRDAPVQVFAAAISRRSAKEALHKSSVS